LAVLFSLIQVGLQGLASSGAALGLRPLLRSGTVSHHAENGAFGLAGVMDRRAQLHHKHEITGRADECRIRAGPRRAAASSASGPAHGATASTQDIGRIQSCDADADADADARAGKAVPGASGPQPRPASRRGVATLRRLALAAIHPVVLTFAAAGYFSYVSGDTVRATYFAAVGLALAWDHRRRRTPKPGAAAATGGPARAPMFSHESSDRRRAAMRRLLIPAALAGAAYSAIVGSFARYSWPTSVAVSVPAVAGLLMAWRASAGSTDKATRLPSVGTAVWAFVWVGASAWELAALYLQPSLTTDSPAHPTLSYLANPLLASAPGRSIVLFLWLAFGWYLAQR